MIMLTLFLIPGLLTSRVIGEPPIGGTGEVKRLMTFAVLTLLWVSGVLVLGPGQMNENYEGYTLPSQDIPSFII